MADVRSPYYRANEPSVIHQAIDDEVVIIHLDHGLYYSLNSTAGQIWNALAAGESADAVTGEMAREVTDSPDLVAAEISRLIDRLVAEGLLVPMPGGSSGSAGGSNAAARGNGAHPADKQRFPFVPPVIERYDDLREMLLLDPIHAVDDSGWPDRRNEG